MNKRFDKLSVGLAAGLILPLAVCSVVLYVRYINSPQIQYLGIKYLINFVPQILSLAVCANLLPFYICLKTSLMQCLKGILAATFSLALFVVVMFIIV